MPLFSGVPFFNVSPQSTASDGRSQAALARGLDRAFQNRQSNERLAETQRQFDAGKELRETQVAANKAKVEAANAGMADARTMAQFAPQVFKDPTAPVPLMQTLAGRDAAQKAKGVAMKKLSALNGFDNDLAIAESINRIDAVDPGIAIDLNKRLQSEGKSGELLALINQLDPGAPREPQSTVGKIRADRLAAEQAGDTEGAALFEKAELKAVAPTGDKFFQTNPDGTVTIIEGAGAAASGIGTAAKNQLEMTQLGIGNAQANIQHVLKNLRPEDVGGQGLFGEIVLDGILPQVGFKTFNEGRAVNRRRLRNVFEDLLPIITVEKRFTDRDAKRIRDIAAQPDVHRSFEQIMAEMKDLDQMFNERDIRITIDRGEASTLTMDQLRTAFQAGDLTEEQAARIIQGQQQSVTPPPAVAPPPAVNPAPGALFPSTGFLPPAITPNQ